MNYRRVVVEAIGYELPAERVVTAALDDRLAPAYRALGLPGGQVEALTGVKERRWWEPGQPLSDGAAKAARKALLHSNVRAADVGALLYTGVCREQAEPATACRTAAAVGVGERCQVFDVSNACLGVLNGMLDVANRIELGQIRAGLVTACESAREINEVALAELTAATTMPKFRDTLATFTGGSGAAAVLLSDGSFGRSGLPRLIGGTGLAAPEHHALCRWGFAPLAGEANRFRQYMATDAVNVLRHGVELGRRTWDAFLADRGWRGEEVDRVVCHQVGSAHQEQILAALGIDPGRDFVTFPALGNMGTVSVPLTAAKAVEAGHVRPGHRVGLLGIGSGLNCLMLGVQW